MTQINNQEKITVSRILAKLCLFIRPKGRIMVWCMSVRPSVNFFDVRSITLDPMALKLHKCIGLGQLYPIFQTNHQPILWLQLSGRVFQKKAADELMLTAC